MSFLDTEKKIEWIPPLPTTLKEAELINQQEWDNSFLHSKEETTWYRQLAVQATVVTEDEATELIRRLHNGDEKAMHTLIEAYTPLAYVLANLSHFTTIDFQDIMMYGCTPGLLMAIHRYNPESEVPFSVFCFKHIQISMSHFFRELQTMK